MINQAMSHGISDFSVAGSPDRAVFFYWYADTTGVALTLPSDQMLREAEPAQVTSGTYSLPSFYDTAYTVSRRHLTNHGLWLFKTCRLGEFAIYRCG